MNSRADIKAQASAQAAQPILDDPALSEALNRIAGMGRLSDADVKAMRRSRRTVIASGTTAMLALVMGVGAWTSGIFQPAPQHYETQRGERLNLQLADGSRVQMNGATSLDVLLDSGQRRVRIARGEAYFDVAHEAKRAFVVEAGGAATQVLGTAFDIDMGRRDVKLTVYRGKVRFGSKDTQNGHVIVGAGWRSRFAAGQASMPDRFDPVQLDWRQNWTDTDEMRLDDLVDTLNRRQGPLILPPPASLAGISLSGRFRLDSPVQLLGGLGEAYGFRVSRNGQTISLIPTNDQDAKSSPN